MKNQHQDYDDPFFEYEDGNNDTHKPKKGYDPEDDPTIEDDLMSRRPRWDEDDNALTILKKKKKFEVLGFLVVKKGRHKNERFDITKPDIIIGRSPKCCDITLDDEDVSRIHCRIRLDEDKGEFHFFDCGSTNGTLVNKQEQSHVILKSHDVITLGEDVEIVFIQV